MISIIISSYDSENFDTIRNNISATCGVNYELIKVENPNLMGICEAYNKGAAQAQYDNLLFIHEDVIFHTNNWGQLLIHHLSNKNVGVLGIAGSSYVPKVPTGWYLINEEYNYKNYIQNNKQRTNQTIKTMNLLYAKVFALDGVFLAVKKSVYEEFLFGEDVKGFHGYDLDFSLRVATKYDNYVLGDIIIEHFSLGNPDKTWFDNNIQIRKKINHRFHENFDETLETTMFHHFLRNYFSYYKCTLKSIFFTLRFLPKKISFKNKYDILKGYLYYFFKMR